MAQYAMVIDLQKCTGCGACGLACKTENNTRDAGEDNGFKWANFYTETVGTYPNVTWNALPTLCNHCSDAACVAACPVNPKAMFKDENGMTIHNDERCIGCQLCADACPYSVRNYTSKKGQYSVISYNDGDPQPFYNNDTAIIPNCTSSPKEVADTVGIIPPTRNDYTNPDYGAVRLDNVTEKCIFCKHRVEVGDQPYCVVSCPAQARIFGDKDDSNSDVAKLIAQNEYKRLKNNKGEFLENGEAGTQPNVYYINKFSSDNITSVVDVVPKEKQAVLNVYPNPANYSTNIEFNLKTSARVSLKVFDVSGRLVTKIYDNELMNSGVHNFTLNTTLFTSGTYLCSINVGNEIETVSLIVKK